MLMLFLFVVFLTCFGMVWIDGFWSAAITTIVVVLAGLVAANYAPLLAEVIEGVLPSFAYFWDYLSFWLLFTVVFGLMRTITDMLSKHHVRFILPVEMAGRTVLGLGVGWLMVCLTCYSLHMGPLAPTAFRGGFQAEPMSNDFLGMAPDQQWLSLVHSASLGSLKPLAGNEAEPPSEFIENYRLRREELEETQQATGSFHAR